MPYRGPKCSQWLACVFAFLFPWVGMPQTADRVKRNAEPLAVGLRAPRGGCARQFGMAKERETGAVKMLSTDAFFQMPWGEPET